MGLIAMGAVGLACGFWRRKFLAIFLLLLTPIFYVWSMHSSGGTPIFLPTLWPHGYYNSRYGVALEVACAFGAGSIVTVTEKRQRLVASLVAFIAVLPWLSSPSKENWICWKESDKNSDARRTWTKQGAEFLLNHYRSGDGVLTEFGDLAGVFCAAQIPLVEVLHEGNGPAYMANTSKTGLARQAKWAMAQAGDKLAVALTESDAYGVVERIQVAGAPVLQIYQRKNMRVPN